MTYPEREALLPEDMSQICTMVKERAGQYQWGDWLSMPLRHSIENLDMELFTKILNAGPDLDDRGSIHAAVGEGRDEFLSILVARGADVNATDQTGKTPLVLALCDGRVTQNARTLLAAGARVDIRDSDRMSALDYVAGIGDVGVMQAIIDRGVDVNEIGFEGQQSDGEATIDMVLYLLRHGASPTHVADPGGVSILHITCYLKYEGVYGVVDLLLRWGADETAEDIVGKTPGMVLNEDLAGSTATAEEIERTRLLLSRAPADRVWRRRGWLVMLRSRSLKSSGSGGSGGSGGDASLRSAKQWSGAGGGKESLDLVAVVAWLAGEGVEGVFRNVVGFL